MKINPVLITLLFFIICSFSNKKITPLSFLKDNDSLVFEKHGRFNSSVDTLDAKRIQDLSSLEFEKKDIDVSEYGVTPDYSINIYSGSERICLIGVWNVGKGKIALNINRLKTDEFYSGCMIDEQLFNSKFKFKVRRQE